jgi:hypothetical protein
VPIVVAVVKVIVAGVVDVIDKDAAAAVVVV